ncbi:transducin family protein / WD-40 repeat family protein isoform X2 [Wolffia australiana]
MYRGRAPPSPPASAAVRDDDEEKKLVALVDHYSATVARLHLQIRDFESQLETAALKLKDAQSKLSRLRFSDMRPSQRLQAPRAEPPTQSRPPLIIPAVRPMAAAPTSGEGRMLVRAGPSSSAKPSLSFDAPTRVTPRPLPSQSDASSSRAKRLASHTPSPERSGELKIPKRMREQEHRDLISTVRGSSAATPIRIQSGMLLSSQHKRKLRCLEINKRDDQLFATTALDGVVNLWKLQRTGSGASLVCSTDCLSPGQRRWPEDIAWHPDGDCLFAAYSADGADAQISVWNVASSNRKVKFLEGRPHSKGIINNISFLPGAVDISFATGGSDHAVVLWKQQGCATSEWKPKELHKNLHSAAVMGVAGLAQKKVVLSVGLDKRICSFDAAVNRREFTHQIDSKCLSVLPNPSDFNLFMVQTGLAEKQIRLFDVRGRGDREVQWLGWKQESSESQSALVSQDWSPDGLYLSSGSADPRFHIFDIRAGSHGPAQSVQAHQKRVFRASWHPVRPLLVSISSDLNLGLHLILDS